MGVYPADDAQLGGPGDGAGRAVSFAHPYDGRPVFITPWEGVTIAGTTDVDHGDNLDTEPATAPDRQPRTRREQSVVAAGPPVTFRRLAALLGILFLLLLLLAYVRRRRRED